MAKRIQVGGRIESKEVGGIVTGAAEILDDAKGKNQSVVNQETDTELERLDQSKQDNLTFDNVPTEDSNNPVKSGGVYAADKALGDAIEAILLLIPSAASALNKLVDTAMMNSSISTATATFKGTYNVVTDLSLTVDATHEQIAAALGNAISTADNNDYAFVQVPVSAESTDIRRTERYKFNGTAWGYEYDLNTSGFTAAQWAAINSGITLALVGKLIGLPTSSELQALLGQKQNTLTFDNVPTAGSANPVKSGGVHTAINDEKTAREQLAQTVTGIDGRVENVEGVIPTGAAANNKLVANNSMEAYVTSIIEAITASFTIATADGHINLTLTQTNGCVASLTLTSSDIASAQALTALTGRVSTAEGNITTLGGRMTTAEGNITSLGGRVSTNETDIANLQQLYNDLQQSKPEPVTALPSSGQQQGVIYRLAGTTSYSDYMWNGSTWVLMATYNNAIDPRPKKASQNLVTSGGVFDNIGALDVSELNATENPHTLAQYVDLSAALAAIPTDYQKGGMSIKFVCTYDNKYVQYRLMDDSWSTTVTDWQGVDDEPLYESKNLVISGGVFDSIKNIGLLIEETVVDKTNIFGAGVVWVKHTIDLEKNGISEGGALHFIVKGTNVSTVKSRGSYFYLNAFNVDPSTSEIPTSFIVPEKPYNQPWEDVDAYYKVEGGIKYIQVGCYMSQSSVIDFEASYNPSDTIQSKLTNIVGIGKTIYNIGFYGLGSPWTKKPIKLSDYGLSPGDTVYISIKGEKIQTSKLFGSYRYLAAFTEEPAGQPAAYSIIEELPYTSAWNDVSIIYKIDNDVQYIELGVFISTTSFVSYQIIKCEDEGLIADVEKLKKSVENISIEDNVINPSYRYVGRFGIDFEDNGLNTPFSLYYGEGVNINGQGSLTPLKQVYSIGTAQADIRAITFEDGSPIIEDNCIFLSISPRTGGAGLSVLKYNIGTNEMNLVGVVILDISGQHWHSAAGHIMFNRMTGKWHITISGHRLSHQLYYGDSYSDLRYGVNYLSLNLLSYENATSGDEDPMIIYIASSSKWYLVYSKEASSTEVQESASLDGPFTHVSNSNIESTGLTVTKVGGQYYVVHGSTRNNNKNNYVYETFPGLESNGTLDIDIDDGAYRGWGTVVPIPDGNKTSYLFFTFDRLASSNEDYWTYGALYIYRAKQSNSGLEFDIENFGVSVSVPIVAEYGIGDLDFVRINAQRNVLDQEIMMSQIKLNSDVLMSKSNIYKSIGNLSLSQGTDKLNVSGTGSELIIGGIHHPYACYEMNIENINIDEERYLYVGDSNGNETILIVASVISDGITKVEAEVNNERTLIGQSASERILICFSGSCLHDSDNIYVYDKL